MVHLDVTNRIVAQGNDVARRLKIAIAQVVQGVLGILGDLLGVPTKFVKLRLDLLSLLLVHFAPLLADLSAMVLIPRGRQIGALDGPMTSVILELLPGLADRVTPGGSTRRTSHSGTVVAFGPR